jgi:hypothetical protein
MYSFSSRILPQEWENEKSSGTIAYTNIMGFETSFSSESQRQRFSFREMPLEVSNRLQAALASAEYARHHTGEAATVSGNTAMLWWIMKGYARAYGDYVVAHEADVIDIENEDDREDILAELERTVTFH